MTCIYMPIGFKELDILEETCIQWIFCFLLSNMSNIESVNLQANTF